MLTLQGVGLAAEPLQDGGAYLGLGVNILVYDYPNTPTRDAILDLRGLQPNARGVPIGESRDVYGATFEEFASKLAASVGIEGSYGGFSAKLETRFTSSSYTSQRTQFLKKSRSIRGTTYHLPRDTAVLKQHLAPNFRNALDRADPASLFDTYGTHVMTAVEVGGEAFFMAHSHESKQISEQSFRVAAQAKYDVIASVTARSQLDSSQRQAVESLGGDQQLTLLGGDRTLLDAGLDVWAPTVPQHPALLRPLVLVPVWELTDDAARARQLEDAFRRLEAQYLRLAVFQQASAPAIANDVGVRVPDAYKMLSGGASADWSGGGQMLTSSYPTGDNHWRAASKCIDAADSCPLRALAVGLHDPNDIWEVRVFETTAAWSGNRERLSVSVPAPYTLVGGGVHLNYRSGNGIFLTESFPSAPDTWTVAGKTHGYHDSGQVTAYAIGLRSRLPGVRLRQDISAVQTGPNQPTFVMSATADRGYRVVGGGVRGEWTGGGILATGSLPRPDGISGWDVKAKTHGAHDGGTLWAYAIGLKVEVDG